MTNVVCDRVFSLPLPQGGIPDLKTLLGCVAFIFPSGGSWAERRLLACSFGQQICLQNCFTTGLQDLLQAASCPSQSANSDCKTPRSASLMCQLCCPPASQDKKSIWQHLQPPEQLSQPIWAWCWLRFVGSREAMS